MNEKDSGLENEWMINYKEKSPKPMKWKWIIVVAIVVFIILANGYIFHYGIRSDVDDWSHLWLSQVKVNDSWIVTVKYAHLAWSHVDGFDYQSIEYSFNVTGIGYKSVGEIDGMWDETNTIIFYDNDNNDRVNVMDTFKVMNNSVIKPSWGTQPELSFYFPPSAEGAGIMLEY